MTPPLLLDIQKIKYMATQAWAQVLTEIVCLLFGPQIADWMTRPAQGLVQVDTRYDGPEH